MGIKPLKKFGQNYLIDKNIVQNMIRPLNLQSSDNVIEIGPGKGFITEEIYKLVDKVTGIEIDSRVIKNLEENFPNLRLIHSDFLKINLRSYVDKNKLKIIGNIPFNLTGNILFKLLDEAANIESAILIVPHDIAKRIIAKKKTKEYGILTILFNYFTTPKIVQKVSSNVFLPKPNLDAAILQINFNKEEEPNLDKNLFIKVVKASFGNRRKTLNNSLRNSIFNNCDFSGLNLPLTKRAEEFNVEEFIELTKYIQNSLWQKKTK